ncbi:hypothetical protein CMI37_34050, partial [Candidatus Pacearchaeota archaeon]|nr:hypothetical protein [Candidatus Pacearchaeota archaeon]
IFRPENYMNSQEQIASWAGTLNQKCLIYTYAEILTINLIEKVYLILDLTNLGKHLHNRGE